MSGEPTQAVLKGLGGSSNDNIGAPYIKFSHGSKSIIIRFDIVNAPTGGHSILGCCQAQELGTVFDGL